MTKKDHSLALPRGFSISLTDIGWILGLMGLGLFIPFAHEVLFKSSFQLPGHHVEWMALVVIGRLTSNKPWAGSLSGGTAAVASPLFFGVNPMTGITYFTVGVIFDLLFRLMNNPKGILTIGLIAGLAHMSKPVLRIVTDTMTGIPYRPLLIGSWYPLMTFLVFGFIGGVLGVLIVRGDKKLIKFFRARMNGA